MEATFLERDASIARTGISAEAARPAERSRVGLLVLNHISGRYPDSEILSEATKIFPNSRVASDLDQIAI